MRNHPFLTRVLPALPALLCLCLPLIGTALAAGREAGTVLSLTPGATVERGGQKIPLEVKAAVYAGDVLRTDATGRLRVWMRDETTLSLGPDTTFDIEEYDDAADKPRFRSKMTGLARMLTGQIVKTNPQGFAVSTPQATVGIRGTILTVQATDRKTTVLVENTLRQVTVNGVSVPSGSKAEVPAAGAAPRISPITPADRQAVGAQLAVRSGGAAVADSRAGQTPAGAPAGASMPDSGLLMANMLADASSPVRQALDSATAMAESMRMFPEKGYIFSENMQSDGVSFRPDAMNYAFSVDFWKGRISDASLFVGHQSVGTAEAGTFNLSGGSGSIGPDGFSVGGFSGTYIYHDDNTIASSTDVSGSLTGRISPSTLAVEHGRYAVSANLPDGVSVSDTGSIRGTITTTTTPANRP